MTYQKFNITILSLLFLLSFSTGCAKYATKDTLISEIENKVYEGMSEEEFKQSVPKATLAEEKGNQKVYTVAMGQHCFWCGTGKAFLRSYEVYATKFTFENGSLVAKERVVDGE